MYIDSSRVHSYECGYYFLEEFIENMYNRDYKEEISEEAL